MRGIRVDLELAAGTRARAVVALTENTRAVAVLVGVVRAWVEPTTEAGPHDEEAAVGSYGERGGVLVSRRVRVHRELAAGCCTIAVVALAEHAVAVAVLAR